MWYLMENDPEGIPVPFYWLGGVGNTQGVSIGRKHVNIRLKASSVSRTHALLFVEKAPFHAHPHPHRHSTVVSVYDSSAYGTFLKYPKGHPQSRSLNSHHIRLDKNKPSQILDGALLSFGAPTAWWRLVWHPVLIVPYRLNETERSHLVNISVDTGVDVSDVWVENTTHFVVSKCSLTNLKLLTALASGSAIVTLAWVEALNHVVKNTFNIVTTAQTLDAAAMATRLPDENQFLPQFDDVEVFGDQVVQNILDPECAVRRKSFLSDISLSFDSESQRRKWQTVIQLCGGTTTPSGSKKNLETNKNKNEDVKPGQRYHISDEPTRRSDGVHVISEEMLVGAVLNASTDGLKKDYVKKSSVGKTKRTSSNDPSDARVVDPTAPPQRKKPRTLKDSGKMDVGINVDNDDNDDNDIDIDGDKSFPNRQNNNNDNNVSSLPTSKNRTPLSGAQITPAITTPEENDNGGNMSPSNSNNFHHQKYQHLKLTGQAKSSKLACLEQLGKLRKSNQKRKPRSDQISPGALNDPEINDVDVMATEEEVNVRPENDGWRCNGTTPSKGGEEKGDVIEHQVDFIIPVCLHKDNTSAAGVGSSSNVGQTGDVRTFRPTQVVVASRIPVRVVEERSSDSIENGHSVKEDQRGE